MMNKYQEALNNLIKVSCPKEKCCKECDIEKICNCEAKWYIYILQELVDKSAPKNILAKHYENAGEKPYINFVCPHCCDIPLARVTEKNHPYEHIYCNRCGQAIDWSDEDE